MEEALAGPGSATVAVSGGSTPKLVFQHLAASDFRWDRTHVFWVDERAVPPTDPQSNYKLAEDYLLKPAKVPHRNVHRIHAELPPEKSAKLYVEELIDFFERLSRTSGPWAPIPNSRSFSFAFNAQAASRAISL